MSTHATPPSDSRLLLDQLAESRERLRRERAAAVPKIEEAERLNREARATRDRVRKAAVRYLKRFRKTIAAERAPMLAARVDLERQTAELDSARAALARDRESFAAEMAEARAATKLSWEQLAAHRAQLAAERAEREAEWARLRELFEARQRETDAAAEALRQERRAAEADLNARRAELAGLDRRTMNARLQLQELEQARARAVAGRVIGTAANDIVSLAVTGDISPRQRTAIEQREGELQRERRELDAMRRELDRLAEDLTDRRRVLAEQFALVADLKETWKANESQTVDELEWLARAVAFRESVLDARDAAQTRQDDDRRERERELWKYQSILDRWQETILDREARFLAERGRIESGIAARRGLVADREAGLDAVCRKWEADHARLREAILESIAECRDQSRESRAAILECEHARRQTLEQAAKLAAWILAAEQQYLESAGQPGHARAARRVNVLRARWDARFARSLRQLDARLDRLQAESKTIEARHVALYRLAADATERQRQLAVAERRVDSDRLLATTLAPEEPIVLANADGWRLRSDAELNRLRTAASLAAEALLNVDAKQDIVPLRPAEAA